MNWYLNAGDLGFFWKEQIQAFSWLPQIFHANLGFGVSLFSSLWLNFPFQLVVKLLSSIGLSWFIIDKLLWLSVIIVAAISSYTLAKYFLKRKIYGVLASIIYITNTYALLLFGGGQLGVALAYALSPIVLLNFITSSDKESDYKRCVADGIKNGLLLSLLIIFDLRLAYLIIGAITVYLIFRKNIRNSLHVILFSYVVPFAVALFIQMFWILPLLLVGAGSSSLGGQFTDPGMLKFLSFADFSHAISLLHPNWPGNLFGKVYFLQPEFLILPVLAFSSLLFLKQTTKNKQQRTYFTSLALIGAFFAKGVQEPFGGIFQWMFTHIPGFILFRDPTKFYLFTAIGYSVLIPIALSQLSSRIRNVGIILFIIFWCFTIRAVFVGQVAGNFRPLTLTPEYMQLKDELVNDTVPSRTLWIPGPDKFVFSSEIHPVLSSDELFHNASASAMIGIINTPEFEKTIWENGVGYVIVPHDPEKRMFLTDYKFDTALRENLITALNKSSLQRVPAFNDLEVYKSDHDRMIINRPQNIEQEQYWVNIGAVISAISLIIILGLLFVIRR
jgi:hypothetical protein